MPTIDRFDDAVGIGGPDEWVRLAVVLACGAPGLETPCVALKEGFMREGVAGLLREKTRKPGLWPSPPKVGRPRSSH